MKLLITSDVHGRESELIEIIQRHPEVNYHLNAGDMALDPKRYERHHIISVKGNNDFGIDLPYERILDLEEKKILLVHGHLEHVKFGLERLKLKAKLLQADIVIFGHTHERYLMVEEHILFINPGALGDYHQSYAIYDDGQVTFYQR
ncbi:MAG: YfcE family phosphodiesterase [Acholeplasma sp.]|jgi:putative phosphoesterase|nr:MAG: YfcE family phosphodiesterase [Acholeplasma sp.]